MERLVFCGRDITFQSVWEIAAAFAAMELSDWDETNARSSEFFKKTRKNTVASATFEKTDAGE